MVRFMVSMGSRSIALVLCISSGLLAGCENLEKRTQYLKGFPPGTTIWVGTATVDDPQAIMEGTAA